jgi:hypothetical protein
MSPPDYSVNEQLRGLVPGALTFVAAKDKFKILDVVVIHPDPWMTKHEMLVPLQSVNLEKHVQDTDFDKKEVRNHQNGEMKGVRNFFGGISATLNVGMDIEAGRGREQTREYDITLKHTCSREVDTNIVKRAVRDHIQKLATEETDINASTLWREGRLILGIVIKVWTGTLDVKESSEARAEFNAELPAPQVGGSIAAGGSTGHRANDSKHYSCVLGVNLLCFLVTKENYMATLSKTTLARAISTGSRPSWTYVCIRFKEPYL